MPTFDNAVVVVTGGGTGVGQGLAYEASRRGARVVIASPRPADETVSHILDGGGQARWIECDVSSYDQVSALAEAVVSNFGGANMIVNNAAGSHSGARIFESDPEKVRHQFEINTLGVFNGIHAFFPHLKAAAERGELAHVLNVGSEHSFGVPPKVPPMSNYTVSKYTTLGFTDASRRDFEGTGVGVSLLAPSWVLTEGLADIMINGPEEIRRSAEGKHQTTEEVARLAFDGVADGKHIIATNPASAEFVRTFSQERIAAFDEIVR